MTVFDALARDLSATYRYTAQRWRARAHDTRVRGSLSSDPAALTCLHGATSDSRPRARPFARRAGPTAPPVSAADLVNELKTVGAAAAAATAEAGEDKFARLSLQEAWPGCRMAVGLVIPLGTGQGGAEQREGRMKAD